MKYFLAGTWVNDDTITTLPLGATLLSDTEWNNRNSTPYVPTLPEARERKLASLEASRKQAIDTLPPITVAAKQYPATPEYREVITGIALRQAAGRPVPGTLRGADGVPVTLTPVLIGQIDDAIAAAVQSVRDRYWTKFDAVNAPDATAASIAAVVW